MSNRKEVFTDLEKKFRDWLPSHGVKAAAKHYVGNLKVIGSDITEHKTLGEAWNGFYELLTHEKPAKGVYDVLSAREFVEVYRKSFLFFLSESSQLESVKPHYPLCENFNELFLYAHSNGQSGTGDGGHTRSGFIKYCQFLLDLESRVEGEEDEEENDHEELTNSAMLDFPRQMISYGAPGTGKSFDDDKRLKARGISPIRTTFHPDSDYSTFVGAYKPTMQDDKIAYSFRAQAFMSAYVAAWKELEKGEGGRTRTDAVKKPYSPLISAMVQVAQRFVEEGGQGVEKSRKEIVARAVELYGGDFSEKSFCPSDYCYNRVNGALSLKYPALFVYKENGRYACYGAESQEVPDCDIFSRPKGSAEEKKVGRCVKGVRTLTAEEAGKPVVLVIEEINRGNCAQIFGDLFQLLDRGESGYSSYPIASDADLAKWLVEDEQFGDGLEGIARPSCIESDDWDEIVKGRKLALPPTLYIWATMNTSDQSLFPMDSAFKRRWDWKYVPIAKPDEPNWKDRKIKIGTFLYDWWDFLTIINKHIAKATESEDKQLGYSFVKAPDDTGFITADQFANKVLFYLYGDVFKSYELPAAAFKRDGGAAWAFRDFFYSETMVVQKADGEPVKDADGNVVKTVTDETTQVLKKSGDVNEFELAAFLDHLKWKDDKGEKSVAKTSAGAVTP